jgi:hypothetical protein
VRKRCQTCTNIVCLLSFSLLRLSCTAALSFPFYHILPYLFPHYFLSVLTSLFYIIYLFLIFSNLTLPNGTGGSHPTGEAVYFHLRLVPNFKNVWSSTSTTNPNPVMDCTLIFIFSLSLPCTFLKPVCLPPCCSFLLFLCLSLVYKHV